MLRKNDLKVYEKVKKYMLENMDFSGRDIPEDQQQRRPWFTCWKIFQSEKTWEINTYNTFIAFDSWIRGLCSTLDIYPVYCKSAADYVAEWREMTPEEREKMDDETGDRLFVEICFRTFQKAFAEEAANIQK